MYDVEPSYDPNDEDEFYDFVDCWLCDVNEACWTTCSVFDANDNDVIDYVDYAHYADEWDLPTFDETRWYYLHDALGSVVGLVGGNYQREDDREFYGYQVYGTPTEVSEVGNPYMFTGRRVDVINEGCYLQYNRNRHYSYNLQRWISPDPLGITANSMMNVFSPLAQYIDGLNLYEYVKSNPGNRTDPYGYSSSTWAEIQFAISFLNHWRHANGALFTKGAGILKKQDGVKEAVGGFLKRFAHEKCAEVKTTEEGNQIGDVNESMGGVSAGPSYWMLWTLGTAHDYKIEGSYEAKLKKCECHIKFKLKHTWVDRGDTNPNHLFDKLAGFMMNVDRLNAITSPGQWFLSLSNRVASPPRIWTDFPIEISWRANSLLVKKQEYGTFIYLSGWPFN